MKIACTFERSNVQLRDNIFTIYYERWFSFIFDDVDDDVVDDNVVVVAVDDDDDDV